MQDVGKERINDMNASLMKEIEQRMDKFLNKEQKENLHRVLEDCLSVPDEESVNQGDLIQLFIAAKRVEGCSAKTVKYYETTVRNAIEKIDKDIVQVTTDDLRIYLDNYQENNGISKVTIDNIRRILSSFFLSLIHI